MALMQYQECMETHSSYKTNLNSEILSPEEERVTTHKFAQENIHSYGGFGSDAAKHVLKSFEFTVPLHAKWLVCKSQIWVLQPPFSVTMMCNRFKISTTSHEIRGLLGSLLSSLILIHQVNL